MLPSRIVMLALPPGLVRWIFGIALAVSVLAMGCNGPDSRVRGSIKAGDEAARQRALREALNHYRTAAVAEPASLEAQTRRAAMAEVLGEFDEALDAYGRASRLQPSALAYYRAGAMAERMGNVALAVEYLTASLQAPPTRGERWAQTGQRWIERVTASLNGSRWARMLPDWVFRSLHVSRVALADTALDREAVAAALFTTQLEAGDIKRALDVARGRGWVQEGADYCAAARGSRGAETRALVGMLAAPERTDCLLPLGRALTDGGLVRLSRLVLQDRIRRSADPRVRREAELFLRHRLPAHDVPKVAESLNIAAYNLQHRFGDQGAAAVAYQKAIAADSKFSWPYANLGRLYMELDQYDLAVDWLGTAIRINPNHFRAHANMGVALQTLRRYEEAVAAYRTALALNPDDASSHANLGRSLLSLGRDAEGLRELQIAVRLDPSLDEERELLSRRLAGGFRLD
ncbi:MAG TPA: tetratricopeptide repeat protein [Candidatus Deferrimicrobiaceae bacterium]|nr:tetratricopeptide repeat protein [Candidatus Deferrimicrobiaceae bacterium]